MKRRKNVSDIAEASVANLMKIAAVAKKNEATKRMTIPLDSDNQRTLADYDRAVYCRTLPFNYLMAI
jgi:hypothetical protein